MLIKGVDDLFTFIKNLQEITKEIASKESFSIVLMRVFELTPYHVWEHYNNNETPPNVTGYFKDSSAPCIEKFKKIRHLVIGYTLYLKLKLWGTIYWIKFRNYNLTAIRYLLGCKANPNIIKLELTPIDIELAAWFDPRDNDCVWRYFGDRVYNEIERKYNALRYHS